MNVFRRTAAATIAALLFGLFLFPGNRAGAAVTVTARVNGVCGNGTVEWNEQCDGTALNGATCGTRGYSGGALSCAVNCTYNVSACTVSSASTGGGGGGGGGGGEYVPISSSASVTFSGRAFPNSTVTLLRDAALVGTTVAGGDANFQMTVNGLPTGNYTFSLYGEDTKGRRSSLTTFSVSISSGAATTIGGIFIAPTLGADKEEVKLGDTITFFGQTVPSSEVTISVHSDEEYFMKTVADASGAYLRLFDTTPLEYGTHSAKSKSAVGNAAISTYGSSFAFKVGLKNVLPMPKSATKGDANGDSKVNLIDFSVMAYWYGRATPPAAIDLNGDNKINIVDFSIMAFHWTG